MVCACVAPRPPQDQADLPAPSAEGHKAAHEVLRSLPPDDWIHKNVRIELSKVARLLQASAAGCLYCLMLITVLLASNGAMFYFEF